MPRKNPSCVADKSQRAVYEVQVGRLLGLLCWGQKSAMDVRSPLRFRRLEDGCLEVKISIRRSIRNSFNQN